VTLTPTTETFSEELLGSTSSAKQVKLLNAGSQAVTISGITTSGDFAQTNQCPPALKSSESCSISVTFSPTATGTRTGTLAIADNAANSPQIVSLSGTGTIITFSPSTLNFGSEPVGQTTAPQNITLTNVSGITSVSISSISIKGAERADFADTNTCGSTLGPGASCTISVTFTPTATGVRSAHVSINDNGGGLQNVSLTGTGT
jgi:hypothetical protein